MGCIKNFQLCNELYVVSDIKGRNRLRMFENRVLRRIFGTKRDEVTGECKKLA
jgi:hypothetical protein